MPGMLRLLSGCERCRAVAAPNEYYYDKAKHQLFMIPNATDGSPPDPALRLVAGKLQTLFSMNATMAHPIKNVSFQGLKFRESRQPSLLLLLLMSQTCVVGFPPSR